MALDRRKFLAAAGGCAVAAVAGKQTLDAVASTGEKNKGKCKRWGMVIDLRKCEQHEGCEKCIDACHVEHNVPDIGNEKEEIKWIWKENFHHAFIEQENERLPKKFHHKHVLLLCNHCDNPPCTNVCPTKATWRREDGIVMMDWHRCVGCRYCVAACPYGSRSFNYRDPRKYLDKQNVEFPTRSTGVVEKCTFCAARLSQGKIPSCVEACPANALVFGDLDDPDSEVRKALGEEYSIRRKPELGTQPEIYYIV